MTPNNNAIERPFFVVGAERSGTTMLRLMIDGHPDLCNFGECEYSVKFARGRAFPDVATYVHALQDDRVFKAHGFEVDAGLSYCELVRTFLRQALERSGKSQIGATVHSRFDLVPQLWPNARFVHLIRDPRDVARSCMCMGWAGNVWYGADFWIEAERRWDSLNASLSDGAYTELHFEALVADPIRELRRVCEFLGVTFRHEMLEYSQTSTYEYPDPSLVNQWRRRLSYREVQLVEQKCRPLMESRGYEPTTNGQRITPLTRVKLAAQNSAARWRFNMRRYGLPLYLRWQVARRLDPSQSPWAKRVRSQMEAVDISHLR